MMQPRLVESVRLSPELEAALRLLRQFVPEDKLATGLARLAREIEARHGKRPYNLRLRIHGSKAGFRGVKYKLLGEEAL